MEFEIQDGVLLKCRLNIGETEVVIPEGVKSIGDRAFYQNQLLESITIQEGVTSIGKEAFTECRSLQSITLPESVTSIGEKAFSYCSSLQSITIPDSVMHIGKDAFHFYQSLQSIVFRGFVIPTDQYDLNLLHKDMPKLREMLRTEDYEKDIPAAVKIPALLTEYRKHPSPKLADWIRKNASEVLSFLIKDVSGAATAAVLQIENLPLPRQEIEKAAALAVLHTQNGGNPEIQMLLLRYLDMH